MGLSQVPSESVLGTFPVVHMLGFFSSDFLFITHFDFLIFKVLVLCLSLSVKGGLEKIDVSGWNLVRRTSTQVLIAAK